VLRLFLILALCLSAHAADLQLESLKTLILGMRGKQPGSPVRGASPQLTLVKHQLRDWVEARLTKFDPSTDAASFAGRLNEELIQAAPLCDWNLHRCPEWTDLGFVQPLELRRESRFLILITGVGIECGFDDSAYIYGWSDGRWKRVWQNEQNIYTETVYKPQTIHSVKISPFNRANDYLILTLGSLPWCTSSWRNFYYRVFRLGLDPDAKPLVEAEEGGFLNDDPPILGSVSANDALVEFPIRSIDVGVHNRPAIRHFSINHETVNRIDPFALSPRDFVDEWLTHGWTQEAAGWSEVAYRPTMRDWHSKLHHDLLFGHFVRPSGIRHCKANPDLWQVGVDFSDPPTPWNKPPVATYFVVRWRPPYRFTMVTVSDQANPDCTEVDQRALDDRPTLFPRDD
jgi:hypothetical protein